MEWLARLGRRLLLFAHRDGVERVLDDELRHHLECETAEWIHRGLTPEAARRRARRDFGAIDRVKEEVRDARGVRPVEDLALDLRYGSRILRRNPGFTAAAIVTLALGIGATTAIFSVVYGILLRPLPYAEPDRLVVLWERFVPKNKDQNVVSLENYEAWRDRARSFEGMAALVPTSVTFDGDQGAERVPGAEVTPGYFTLLGVPPALGRDFTGSDAHDGGAVILSDGFWKRRFGGDGTIVGRRLPIGRTTYTVAGVMPAGFDPPRFGWLGPQDLWFPLVATPQARGWGRFLLVVARTRRGIGVEQARAEMVAIAERRAAESANNTGWSASVVPLARQITGDVRTSLFVVLTAVALLLLMAVTNVATLTLSAIQRRGRELAVRRAVGATNLRLFRQLFTQSALLGAIGTAAGLLVAVPGTRWLVALMPAEVPRLDAIRVDGPVLAVTAAAALVATLGFGSIAALKGPTAATLRDDGDSRATAHSGGGFLVAGEIALGLALSVMAVLMVRSFVALRSVDLGFQPDGVAVVRIAAPADRYPSPESQRAFFDLLVARTASLPGVESAAIISARPFGGIGPATAAHDAGRSASPSPQSPTVDVRFVDPGVFRTLRIPMVSGSPFDRADDRAGTPHAVISASLAQALWPGQDAVGKRMGLAMFNDIICEVSAVVGDVHLIDARTAVRPTAYLSAARFPDTVRDLVVRVDGDPASIVPALRASIAGIEPGLPVYLVSTLPAIVDRSLAGERFTMFLLSAFAVVALVLAAVGIFGVFSGDVTRRQKEIGIRMALGSTPAGVIVLMMRHALARAGAGIAVGIGLSLVLGRSMAALLFGVDAADPASLALVAIVVVALAAAATLIPALHAVRVPPVAALRDN